VCCAALRRAGEPGLKRQAKLVDNAVAALHLLLAEHLAPALELVAFHLGELLGAACCHQGALGLKARSAEQRPSVFGTPDQTRAVRLGDTADRLGPRR
jgi:Anaphase-promoting complex, cyclosome, subunit 4